MPNMSYCRFQNTLTDLRDCLDALQSGKALSKDELYYAQQLVLVADEIVGEAEEQGDALGKGKSEDESDE